MLQTSSGVVGEKNSFKRSPDEEQVDTQVEKLHERRRRAAKD